MRPTPPSPQFIHDLTTQSAPAVAGATDHRERTEVPDRYKWNLADIYQSEGAWREAKDALAARLPELGRFREALASSPQVLADALETMTAVDKTLSRLYVYASMLADEDTRDSRHEGMRQEMVQLAAAFRAEASFVEPEILKMGKATLEQFISGEPRLSDYRFPLEDIVRRAAHTLSDSEEKLLADAGPLSTAPSNVHSILTNADFPYPLVTLSDGRSVTVNQAAYEDLRARSNRGDREQVMSAFLGSLGKFSRTFGTMMHGTVQKALFFSKARRYGSSLEAALDASNIPTAVYMRLLEGVNRHVATFHRYLTLRRRMLGVDALHYYDMYAPVVASVDLAHTPEQAEARILEAMAPLGADYQAVIERSFTERWIDYFPTVGKRSGAYSNGYAYDVHPYMLLNYNGKYTDVSTLAHELGHTMQSYLSNQTQPYQLAGYPIFVAEVASTFNERLLIDRMLHIVQDRDTRLSLLGSYLDSFKGTLFRQTQFAEFELRMHEMGQQNHPITGDTLAELYLGITRKLYGHQQGVCVVDDYVAHEWSFIPHFHHEFYVYQYATSFTASMALAEKVKAGDAEATKKYLRFLSAGGSKYPIDLLKDAGVDMTTEEPLELTIKAMNHIMDEMDGILGKEF